MTKEEKIKYELAKNQQELRSNIDDFLGGNKFKSVEEGFTEFKKARKELKKGITLLEDIKVYLMYKDNRHYKKINKILETTFLKVGKSKIKRPLILMQISKVKHSQKTLLLFCKIIIKM